MGVSALALERSGFHFVVKGILWDGILCILWDVLEGLFDYCVFMQKD